MLQEALEDEFPNQIEVIGLKDSRTTGNFEVTVKETGQIIHSKKAGGGYVNSPKEWAQVVATIKSILGK